MFDVGTFTFGMQDIAKHMHTRANRRSETVEGQKRVLKKWVTQQKRMLAFTQKDFNEVSAWQLERVSTLVDFVYSSHPFYHQLYKSVGYRRGDIVTWDDYNALPTINKQDVINNYDLFTKNLDQTNGQSITVRSSGSSGQVLTINLNPTSIDYDALLGFRFNEQMLGRPRRPSEWLYLVYVECPPFTSFDGLYPAFTVSNECPTKSVLAHLEKIKPAILSSLPNSLLRLAEQVDDPSRLGIKAICTNSEPSSKAERQKIAEGLGAPVFDEYSSCELGLIATECHKGIYHIVEDNVRVDVLNPDKEGVGEIVATPLFDTYMPLIRYRQGDVIQIGDGTEKCECGNRFRSLKSFLGRTDQQLLSRKTGAVPSDLIMSLYDRTLLMGDAGIDGFKIIQEELDSVSLIVVPKSGDHVNYKQVDRFAVGLKEIFSDPDLEIKVQEKPELPHNKSYKRRLIENRIPLQP